MGCVSSTQKPDAVDENEDVKLKAAQQRRKLSMAPANVGPVVKKGEEDKIAYDEQNPDNMTTQELEARGPMRHHLVSVKGIVPYSKNKVNQDRGLVRYALSGNPRVSMFGVMDGHGEFGHDVSQYIKDVLPTKFDKLDVVKDPTSALLKATKAMSDQLDDERQAPSINTAFSGSTLVYGLLIDRQKLFVANVGDSRCVVCRNEGNGKYKTIQLSEDQKPENPGEKERILAAGGRVETLPGPPDEDLGPQRVWLAEVDVPGLAMSRSIGDQVSKQVGVISVPEIKEYDVVEKDEFVIFASDGVWEFFSSEEAVAVVWKHRGDLNKAAHELVKESIARWKKEEEVVDDTTCVIIGLNNSEK